MAKTTPNRPTARHEMNGSESSAELLSTLRDAFGRLRQPITNSDDLLRILRACLAPFGLLPSPARASQKEPKAEIALIAQHSRILSSIQGTIVTNIVPTWDVPLTSDGNAQLLEQLFCPLTPDSAASRELALTAYSVLLSNPIGSFTLRVLPELLQTHPFDDLNMHLFAGGKGDRMLEWELLVKVVGSLQSKVANAVPSQNLPEILQSRNYSVYLCQRFELLISRLCHQPPSDARLSSVTHILVKMIQIGLFPLQSKDPLRVSFFNCSLPNLRKLAWFTPGHPNTMSYLQTWRSVVMSLPSSAIQSFLTSLISALPAPADVMGHDLATRQLIKEHARILSIFVVPRAFDQKNDDDAEDVRAALAGLLMTRNWNEHMARVAVCWESGLFLPTAVLDEAALVTFSESILDVWSSPQHNQNPLVTRHRYITCALLVAWSYLPNDSSYVKGLATSEKFLGAVSKYLGNLDPAIRLMGMAVAEEVAKLSGRKLEFGGWEGEKDGRTWIRQLRELIKARDADVVDAPPKAEEANAARPSAQSPLLPTHRKPHEEQVGAKRDAMARDDKNGTRPIIHPRSREPDSDDDSLVGYDSEPCPSRGPSPTLSELDEIEKDPTLRTGGGLKKGKKLVRPVYLVSLGELLRPSAAEGDEEVRKIEMALTYGEELIRRKRDFGTELEENAADLCIGTLGLQDKYELDRFEGRRQAILLALVACCPVISSPCLIEQFFHNQWSATHRFAILNALALGARELAELATPMQATQSAFPSRMLPKLLHDRYITEEEKRETTSVASIAEGITRLALEKGKAEAEEKVPEIIREKQLRIRKKEPSITQIRSNASPAVIPTPSMSYSTIAAEYFIIPLIDKFWEYLRDEQTREARTQYSGRAGYRGAGTGMILDSLILQHFLSSLAVIVHAARHSNAFLRIIVPSALEVAVTLGSKPVSSANAMGDEDDDRSQTEKENSVLAASLELALVILDAAYDLDEGRTVALESTSLLSSTREWASSIFLRLDAGGGMMVDRESSDSVNRVRRATAGVVLKIEEMLDKWRRVMIDL